MLYLSQHPRPCTAETQRALHAADGYLYFGLSDEALAELDTINASEQDETPVLLARIRALLHGREWRSAETLSNRGLRLHPSEGEFTVQRAFALSQMKKSAEATKVMLAAPEWIRRTGILHYNLACYEARLGDLEIARECIDKAIEMNSGIKKNARLDPDLKALWN
jgi:tetratricopeptide (TPR) repeat protein